MRRIPQKAVSTAVRDEMKRKLVLGAAALLLTLLVAPVVSGVLAAPPLPPTTYFGAAPGATPGQSIIALIDGGSGSVVCGSGEILATPSTGTVYRVDVVPDASRSGCGAPGRLIRFYVPGESTPGWIAINLAPWSTAPAVQVDLIFAPPLNQQRSLPESASDGTY